MKIKTFTTEKYKECPIYYRNFSTTFEYLTVIKNQIYTAQIIVKPTLINSILFYLKIAPEKYSNQQYKNILKILKIWAQTTIDTILQDNKK